MFLNWFCVMQVFFFYRLRCSETALRCPECSKTQDLSASVSRVPGRLAFVIHTQLFYDFWWIQETWSLEKTEVVCMWHDIKIIHCHLNSFLTSLCVSNTKLSFLVSGIGIFFEAHPHQCRDLTCDIIWKTKQQRYL